MKNKNTIQQLEEAILFLSRIHHKDIYNKYIYSTSSFYSLTKRTPFEFIINFLKHHLYLDIYFYFKRNKIYITFSFYNNSTTLSYTEILQILYQDITGMTLVRHLIKLAKEKYK